MRVDTYVDRRHGRNTTGLTKCRCDFTKITTSSKSAEIEKRWIVIDATDVVLGRLASLIALRLRGKHKPSYTPHMDDGDNVIVINAKRVALTGRKRDEKTYYYHTGFPGGLKERTAKEILAGRFPERVIEKATERMLPRGPLGRSQLGNLRVYGGPDHPHMAQQPVPLNVAEMNPKNTIAGPRPAPISREPRNSMSKSDSQDIDGGLWIRVTGENDRTIVSAHRLGIDDPFTVFWPGKVALRPLETFFGSNLPNSPGFVRAIVFEKYEKHDLAQMSSTDELFGAIPKSPEFVRFEYQAKRSTKRPVDAADFIAWASINKMDEVGVYLTPDHWENVSECIAHFIATTHADGLELSVARESVTKIFEQVQSARLAKRTGPR